MTKVAAWLFRSLNKRSHLIAQKRRPVFSWMIHRRGSTLSDNETPSALLSSTQKWGTTWPQEKTTREGRGTFNHENTPRDNQGHPGSRHFQPTKFGAFCLNLPDGHHCPPVRAHSKTTTTLLHHDHAPTRPHATLSKSNDQRNSRHPSACYCRRQTARTP